MKPFHQYFDHTLLKPDATEVQIMHVLSEAARYGFAAVCVNGSFVRAAAEYLQEVDVKVASVVGFPLGASTSDAKAGETRIAIADGADEIDMVLNIGAVKDGRWDYIRYEIHLLAQICHEARAKDGGPVLLKVILETCLLTDDEIILACQMVKKAGADFVKTSTGFSSGGATVRHVQLMRRTVGDALQVKASGGIRTLADARAMIEAGADRLGCSASAAIMEEYAAAE
ncbi:MAG: deoxyribose-phosphate aldolase [Firmicutes bacterium]|nr:deoxyribose-phosphate aldolase [Bacillota bacterium]